MVVLQNFKFFYGYPGSGGFICIPYGKVCR